MSWVEIYESHTPYEWLIQQCLAVVDPWGDERADLRDAINTMTVLPGGDYDRNEVMKTLVEYLKINEREAVAGPSAARMMLES